MAFWGQLANLLNAKNLSQEVIYGKPNQWGPLSPNSKCCSTEAWLSTSVASNIQNPFQLSASEP